MGKVQGSQAEAHDLSSEQEEDGGGSESKVGEGEARSLKGTGRSSGRMCR
jgi:hypothetical protein